MIYDWPRQLSHKDMLEIVDLMNAVAVREHTLGFFEPLSQEDGLALMRDYDAQLRRGELELLAVRADDGDRRIVGMLTLERAHLPARRHVIDMRRCVIAPESRGQFLLQGWEQALYRVRDLGCEVITLEVRDDGPFELWRRIGFRDYGVLPDYARHDGAPVTGYFMYARCSEVLEHFATTGSWIFDDIPAAVVSIAS